MSRPLFLRSVVFSLALMAIGATALGVCIPTVYSATSSAPPPSGNWTDTSGALWTPAGGFPGCAPGDVAADTNASPTTFIINSSIPNPIIGLNLACNGCVIDIQPGGALTLAGAGSIGSGATLKVSGGNLTVANGGTMTLQAGSSFQIASGAVDIQPGGAVSLGGTSTVGSGGTMQVAGSVTIPSGSLDVQSGGQLSLEGGTVNGPGAINNSGLVTSSTSSAVSAALNNLTGATGVSVTGGTLALTGGGTGDAPFTIDGGATLDFPSGSYTLNPNGVVTGDGTLSISGGTLSIGGVTSPGGFTLTAGTLTGAGFLSVQNTLLWSGGTMTGSGGSELAGTGTGTLDGATGPMTLDGRTFNDYGYLTYNATTSSLYLQGGSTLAIFGTFDITDDASIGVGAGAGVVQISPNGLLEKSGGTLTSTIEPSTMNDSNVYVFSGTLDFIGGGTHNGGFFSGSPATLQFTGASNTFTSSSAIFGDGDVTFNGGTIAFSGFYDLFGQTTIQASALLDASSAMGTNDFLLDAGATLRIADDFLVFNNGTWSGGTIAGNGGTFYYEGLDPDAFTIDAANGSPTLDGATFVNDGGTVLYTATANSFDFANGAELVNDGLFDIQSDRPINSVVIVTAARRPVASAHSRSAGSQRPRRQARHPRGVRANALGSDLFTNASGTLDKSAGAGTTDFGPDLANSGTVIAGSGVLHFLGSYNQTAGTTTLGPGSITTDAALQLGGGTLDGAGTLTGDLQNDAVVSPGSGLTTGIIDVTGNYTQGSTGTLEIDLAGSSAGQFDQLTAGGATTLDGTFTANLLNSYAPANGTTWPVLTFASRAGAFAAENLPTYPVNGSIISSFTPTEFDLTAVVAPLSTDLAAGMTGPANVNAGEPLSYTVTVSNNGPNDTSGTITLTNTLPSGVTSASGAGAGWSCGAPSGGTITCTNSTVLLNGQSLPSITFSMTAPPDGGSVSNSATVVSPNSDPNGTNDTASITTTVAPQSDVSITKSGPGGVIGGQNVTYTIVVTNNGPSQATSVVVSDPTPANLTFVSNSGACTTPYPCSLGTLASGAMATITSTYSTSPSFSGNVINTATVSSAADPNNLNDSASATTNVGAQADLSISKSGPASGNPGQNIVYTITVFNAGPSPAANTVIDDPTPVGIAFLSNSGACATPFPCNVGTLAAGQSVSVTSTYNVPGGYTGASVINTATVASDVNDPSTGDNTSMVTTTIAQQTDLSISKSGPASIAQGQNIVYTITATNLGPSSAANVVVTDATPAGLTFVSTSGACTTAFPCNIGTLSPSQSATITATYSVPANFAGTSIDNTASIASDATDANASNDSSSVTTPVVGQADLSVAKSGPPFFTPGQNITYTITVSNLGPLSASNTFVSDPTPPGLTFVSNSGACAGPFPCSLGALASGQSVIITSTYTVPAGFAANSITNTATVSSSTNDLDTSNNTSSVNTPSTGLGADLALTKSGPANAHSGDTINFAIVVKNDGPATATGIVIDDPVPAGLSFVSVAGACASFPCNVPSLAAQQTLQLVATYTVQAGIGVTLANTASVSTATTDPTAANNTSSALVRIVPVLACPVQAPQLVSPDAGAITESPVEFFWSGVADATGYTLTISGPTPVSLTTTQNSASATLANGSYTWSVQAFGANGCPVVPSSTRPFTICSRPSAPAASVVGESTTGQTYAVQWTASGESTSYELQESSSSAFMNPTVMFVGGTSKSFTKVASSPTAFFYRVRAVSNCPGPFSTPVSVVVVPLPKPDGSGTNINIPAGSQTPVTFQVFVPGLPGVTTSFIATVDKPWLAVTPTSGIITPEGILLTVSADPTTLTNGTWNGTVIVVYGSTGVSSKVRADGTTSISIPVTISLVTPVTPAALQSPAENALIIPSVGHLPGVNSNWRSDVRVANVSNHAQEYRLTFNSGTGDPQVTNKSTTLSLNAGVTTALDDIVRNWYGIGDLGDAANGLLTIESLGDTGSLAGTTIVSSRTFNAAGGTTTQGTFGQFIPTIAFSQFIRAGQGTASTLSLQQIAQSAIYRTNLGLAEASGKPVSALVTLFDEHGIRLLDLPIALKGGEQRQLNSFIAEHGLTVGNGRIEVQAVGGDGRLTAYASVIDGRTGDPLLVSGVPRNDTGADRFIVPGIASLNVGFANWQSDVHVFNGGATPQTATLTFYPTGNPDGKVSQVVTLNPGEVKTLDNVVQSAFGITNEGGTLHVTTEANAPLVVTARTYDLTASGTLGQFVPAVTLNDAVGAGERALQILQAEESSRYRTNLGIAEVSGKPAMIEVTVTLPDSKVSPTVQIPLAAFESRQVAILHSLGLDTTYNARISVRVIEGEGRVTAYGSVIDAKTQDPTYVPAQ